MTFDPIYYVHCRLECPLTLSEKHFLTSLDVIDRSIPNSELNHRIVSVDNRESIQPIRNRGEVVRAGLSSKDIRKWDFPTLRSPVDRSAFILSANLRTRPPSADYWSVCLEMPPGEFDPTAMTEFFLAFGDSLTALHGDAGTYHSATIHHQIRRAGDREFHGPPLGLPELFENTIPSVPVGLTWANYWSSETTKLLGFSPSKHASLFFRWQRGPSGSLAFQLTPKPIDLDRPEDIEALKRAYEAFPGVGGRDPQFRLPDDGGGAGGEENA
jgi:hypothetical protein